MIAARGRDFDWLLALASLGGALACAWLLVADRSVPPRPQRELPEVATLSLARAEVRRRAVGTLGWSDLELSARVHDLDSVFVPPGSAAGLTFDDGSRLELDENSLALIQRQAQSPGTQTQVELLRGSASGTSGPGGIELRGGGLVAQLPREAGATVSVTPGAPGRIEVFAGTAQVKTRSGTQRLEQQQSGSVGADGELATATFAVPLRSPARATRTYFQQAPGPIELAFSASGGEALAVQVAGDAAFRTLLAAGPAPDGVYVFTPKKQGVYWWRVVGPGTVPMSEARRLEVIEDLPPILTSPGPDEQLATAARAIPLAWARAGDAPLYEVEISADDKFARLAFSAQVASNHLWVSEPLPEGRYHWRVRTAQAERGESPWSASRSFILIDRPLPDVPELIDSELEVTGAKKR